MGNCLAEILPCLTPEPAFVSYGDYKCEEPLTDEGQDLGACKTIVTGTKISTKTPCVLCFAQEGRKQSELKYEAEMLQHCGAHPNVIGLFEYFSNWGGGNKRKSCLILELVEPPGNDLYEVHQSFKATGSFMPTSQLRWYIEQLAQGLEFVNSKGIIHRDMKVENMLIDSNHNVKIIDFGLAICPPRWKSSDVLSGSYFAPELEAGGNNFEKIKYADLWGIGTVLYYVSTGRRMNTQDIKNWNARGMFKRQLTTKLACHKDDEKVFGPILQQVLATRGEDRGTFQDVVLWAREEVRSSADRKAAFAHSILEKWPFRKGVPQALGMRVPPGAGGKTVGELALSDFGMLVIAVVSFDMVAKKRKIISSVDADTKLFTGDWIFFGVNQKRFKQKEFIKRMGLRPGTEISVTRAKNRKQKDLTWFFPTFDAFEFKEQHFNAVIGPKSFAKEGQNALDLRANFEMNLCGIVGADHVVKWWPGADKEIKKGDKGLLMRVPNFIGKNDEAHEDDEEIGGCAADIEMLKAFLDPGQFSSMLKLSQPDSQRWSINSQNQV
mmetsp:Transcript_97458/g.178651  ORF Transcript_97458/g.178651 Transcript_97458/m.178651 type:complete len:551 (-) Transcript_97458:102-1754(-)